MTDAFTLEELQHTMAIMNGDCLDVSCPYCASARKKLQAMIAEYQKPPELPTTPAISQVVIGGHTVTREIQKKFEG